MVSKPLGHLLGVNLEKVDTVAEFALGTIVDLTDGGRAMYVRANGAFVAEGYVGHIDAAFDATPATTTSADGLKGLRVGVAQAAVADNEYFWAVIHGRTLVQVSASAAANAALATTATAGQLDDATTTGLTAVEGIFLLAARGGTAGTAAAEVIEARLGAELA